MRQDSAANAPRASTLNAVVAGSIPARPTEVLRALRTGFLFQYLGSFLPKRGPLHSTEGLPSYQTQRHENIL